MFENITLQQLKRAVAIKEQIQSLERELAEMLGRSRSKGRRTGGVPATSRLSANTGRFAGAKTRKRRMTAAARARIAAATRARWAKVKAQGKKAL